MCRGARCGAVFEHTLSRVSRPSNSSSSLSSWHYWAPSQHPDSLVRPPSTSAAGYDELEAAIRYAQKVAVASGCRVRVSLDSTSYELRQQAALGGHCDAADLSFPLPVLLPHGQTVSGTPRPVSRLRRRRHCLRRTGPYHSRRRPDDHCRLLVDADRGRKRPGDYAMTVPPQTEAHNAALPWWSCWCRSSSSRSRPARCSESCQ